MTKCLSVFSCGDGLMVEALNSTEKCAELNCCGKPMKLMVEKTQDQGQEKHVPVISEENDKMKIAVGEVPHPMEEKHYIQWVELIKNDLVVRKYLKPGQAPEAMFCNMGQEGLKVRAMCNIHGLWVAGDTGCCSCK